MSGFIRPEARAAIKRWREVIVGAGLAFLGGWWMSNAGLMSYVGTATAMLGAALVVLGLQRARFRGQSGGPGSVDVDEGQITYFGPLTGGAIAIRELRELALIRSRQTPHWRLSTRAEELFIPTDAAGADDLFDAFTALPGLRTERMLAALRESGAHDTVIWQITDRGADPSSLH